MKKFFLFALMTIGFALSSSAQSKGPDNAEKGKCYYQKIKSFEKTIDWVEVRCNKMRKKVLENDEKIKSSAFKTHQQKLVELGYMKKATLYFDDEFVKAHNAYIADQKNKG